MEKQRAIAYVRVSGERQVTEGSSLITQESVVKSHAMQRGYLLMRTFVEAGQSAKTDQRPKLKEMLVYCKERRSSVDVVIFPKVDRFARYHRDYANLKFQLEQLDIRLESVSEGFDNSPAGRFMENMLAATAQFDNEVRAERARDGMVQAVKDGRWVWSAPPGYRRSRVNGKMNIEPNREEAAIMRQAFVRLAKGVVRPNEVRLWLWGKGIQLSRSSFYRTISKKLYVGIIEAYGREYPCAPPFLPLISESMFNAAQANLQRRRSPHRYECDHPDFPLRGTVRCRCGRMMTACWAHGRNNRYAHYRCMHCPKMNIPKEVMERWFAQRIDRSKVFQKDIPRFGRLFEDRWEQVAAEFAERQLSSDRQIKRLRLIQRALALKSAQDIIPDDLAREQIAELQTKINSLEASRATAEPLALDQRYILDRGMRFLSMPGHHWCRSDLSEKKRLQSLTYPTGVTYDENDQFRTGKPDLLTGLEQSFYAKLSQEAGILTQIPNLVAGKQRLTRKLYAELWIFFTKLYEVLGPAGPDR